MKYLNLKRALFAKLAFENLIQKKNIKLRVPHANALLLIFELQKACNGPVSGTKIHYMLACISRGGDYQYLQRLLSDLLSHGYLEVSRADRIRKYYVTSAGRLFLNDYEKKLRLVRIDRRILTPKNKKTCKRK